MSTAGQVTSFTGGSEPHESFPTKETFTGMTVRDFHHWVDSVAPLVSQTFTKIVQTLNGEKSGRSGLSKMFGSPSERSQWLEKQLGEGEYWVNRLQWLKGSISQETHNTAGKGPRVVEEGESAILCEEQKGLKQFLTDNQDVFEDDSSKKDQ